MTPEEKARAYDKAFESIKKFLAEFKRRMPKDVFEDAKTIFEDNFPELAESEDERIRKSIIAILNNYVDNSNTFKPKMLAWLEKQGQQDDYDDNIITRDDEILQAISIGLTDAEKDLGWSDFGGLPIEEIQEWLEKQGESDEIKAKTFLINKGYPIDANGTVPTYEEMYNIIREGLEKQGEQKPIVDGILTATNYDKLFQTCKVPKFNVGDWVVFIATFIATESVYQIEKIENYKYTLRHILGGTMPLPFSDEELIRPWTIKDAKPGDVLASGQLTFIFKVIHGAWLNCHCSAHNDGSFIADSYDLMANKYFSEVHPATKEQRDTLTKAMADAGYTFDFDKKELRKIEPNLSNSAKIEKDDTLLDLLRKIPSYITVDGIDYHFVLKKTIAYETYYEGVKEGCEKTIFWTGGNPVDILTEMLEKLNGKGLLE